MNDKQLESFVLDHLPLARKEVRHLLRSNTDAFKHEELLSHAYLTLVEISRKVDLNNPYLKSYVKKCLRYSFIDLIRLQSETKRNLGFTPKHVEEKYGRRIDKNTPEDWIIAYETVSERGYTRHKNNVRTRDNLNFHRSLGLHSEKSAE